MTIESNFRWRVGLLISTVTLGVLLAVTGISGYLQAKKSSEILEHSEVMAVWNGLRRELRRSRGDLNEAIHFFVADKTEHKVAYAAAFDSSGDPITAFGSAQPSVNGRELVELMKANQGGGHPMPRQPIIRNISNGIIRAILPLPRRRMGPTRARGHMGQGGILVLDVMSKEGSKIISTALTALIIELGAGLVLLVISILFWRQSVLAERNEHAIEKQRGEMAVQLEKDKNLKTLGRMSAILGHELRNPIAALKGHAQLLLEKTDKGQPGYQQARTIVSQAEQLETLTHQILSFARTGELSVTKVYIDDLAHGAVAISGVDDIEISVPEEVSWMMDRTRMEQALVNLLMNAREASTGGKPIALDFSLGGERLFISVKDRGSGIPDDKIDKIFEPFHTGRAQGTGLGLALVQRIVERHGGTITAKNRPDGGAEFKIALPATVDVKEQTGEENV